MLASNAYVCMYDYALMVKQEKYRNGDKIY